MGEEAVVGNYVCKSIYFWWLCGPCFSSVRYKMAKIEKKDFLNEMAVAVDIDIA